MGVYDCLPKGSQVKLWNCEMLALNVGSKVPDFGLKEYIVLLREGGYIRVIDGRIIEIVEDGVPRYPDDFRRYSCFDKWGLNIKTDEDLKGSGILGEDYYFKKES